ncbi:site-specific tyrosine recombinase XerC [Actinomyces howellii]|uniref:Site-specific tyrosine recombinase XerC n=2 Tax=Actinomyces howellii TaxID=52771 RepID=A0A3S4SMS9_9ACTO|nr:site-specific tyrosine recombinase XerC [Actinomyces howellii]
MSRGKGEGSVFRDAARDRWVAMIELPADPVTGRRRRKKVTARSKAEALRRMRAVQVEVERAGDVTSGRPITVGEWMDLWIARDVAPHRKPSTTADYRSVSERHIKPALGRTRLDRVTPGDVRRLHERVTATGASSTTAAKVHRVLRTALGAAEREGAAARNPARLVRSPPSSRVPPRSMSTAEAKRFLEGRRERGDWARWAVALMLGVRQGEALGMTLDLLHLGADPWVELAWEVRRVTWEHGCGERSTEGWPCGRVRGADCPDRRAPVPAHLEAEQVHGGLWLLRPKTTGSHRAFGLPRVVADGLAAHLDRHRPARFVFEAAPGVPVDPRRDWGAWRQALAEEGLPPMRLHSARHTAATLLLEAGVPVRTAQEILGQTQALTTARYQHPGRRVTAAALEASSDLL